jgi:enoyl-CoA hydratase
VDSSVRFETRDSVLLITLDSPDQFPRLTRAVLRELLARFESMGSNAGCSAVVITGTESSFAAGADLAEVSALTPVDALEFSALGQSVMRAVETFRKPVIAAIRGYCLGGGFDLAMACHIRLAGEDASFGHPGGSLGIITGWGGTSRLPRIVGASRAREILTAGRVLTAAEAFSWRLVSHVVPSEMVLDESLQLAERLSRR